MFTNVRMIIAGVLALAMLGAGYALGARRVHSLQDQIANIKRAGDEASANLSKTQADISRMSKEKEDEYLKEVAALKTSAEETQKKLSEAEAGAANRSQAAQREIDQLKARKKQLEAERDATNDPSKKKEFQVEIDAGDKATQGKLLIKQGNDCLTVPVPAESIAALINKL